MLAPREEATQQDLILEELSHDILRHLIGNELEECMKCIMKAKTLKGFEDDAALKLLIERCVQIQRDPKQNQNQASNKFNEKSF
jgi:hypothetical protein